MATHPRVSLGKRRGGWRPNSGRKRKNGPAPSPGEREDLAVQLAGRDRTIARLKDEIAQLQDKVAWLRDPSSSPRRFSEEISPIWTGGHYDWPTWEKLITARLEVCETAAQADWLFEENWASFRAYDADQPGAGTALAEKIRKRMAKLARSSAS